jgi:glutathione peroxidase
VEVGAVTVLDDKVTTLGGPDTTLGELAARALLVVNVASQCGFTPQYTGLQALYDRYRDRGLVVAGFPCNQFGGQEPGTAAEIGEFCSVNYGVTFPMFAKIDVNGPGRHPVFAALTAAPDPDGKAGDVRWNFEKFLVGANGIVLARFRTRTEPQAPEVIEAIEAGLADSTD